MDNLKRKKKLYYKQSRLNSKKSKKNFSLDIDMKGFLITCNNNEKKAVAEAYNILKEYANKIYGNEENFNKDGSDDEDIESALQDQINSIKSNVERRFQNLDTNINNCVFIKTTLPDPTDLLNKIFDTDKPCNARFILRMLPVVKTCRSNVESIEKMAEEQLLPVFANLNPAPSFSIIYKIRNNNSINKGIIYSIIGRIISNINPIAKVHLDDPDVVISVDVMQKICCLSILRHYKEFKKYNLHEMSNPSTKKPISMPSDVILTEKLIMKENCRELVRNKTEDD